MSADEPPAAPSLRERGNSAFKNRDFETAEALYSAAIDETSSDADGDAASLLSNRAAARVELGKLDDAIADADSAIARAPTWTKAFYRKSQALRAKGDAAAACAALEQAVQLEPSSKFLAKQLQLAQASLRQRHREQPIESLEDWLSRWALVEAVLERLATFAFFWNALSADERSKAFLKFLVLQSSTGVPPPNASEFTAQVFQEKLPTENYELSGISPVAVWMEFFTARSTHDKIEMLAKMWEASTEDERTIILTDLKRWFLAPVIARREHLSEAGGDREDGEDDEGG